MSDTLAIITKVQCGVGDRGRAWLELEVRVDECSCAMSIIEWDDAKKVIEAYGVSDVSQLNGRPCWVDTSRPDIIAWSRPWTGP